MKVKEMRKEKWGSYVLPIFIVLMIFGTVFFLIYDAYKQPPVTHENILVTITDKKSTGTTKTGHSHRFYFDDGTYINVSSGTYNAYDIGDIMEVTQYYQDEKLINVCWGYVPRKTIPEKWE